MTRPLSSSPPLHTPCKQDSQSAHITVIFVVTQLLHSTATYQLNWLPLTPRSFVTLPPLHFVASRAICVIICSTLIAQMRRQRRRPDDDLTTTCRPGDDPIEARWATSTHTALKLITADWPHKSYSHNFQVPEQQQQVQQPQQGTLECPLHTPRTHLMRSNNRFWLPLQQLIWLSILTFRSCAFLPVPLSVCQKVKYRSYSRGYIIQLH